MTAVFLLMLKKIVQLNLLFFALAVVTAGVLIKLGEDTLAELIGVFLVLTALIGPIETGRKVPFLLSFPFSRPRMILMMGCTNLISGAITVFMTISFYAFSRFYFQQEGLPAGGLTGLFQRLSAEAGSISETLSATYRSPKLFSLALVSLSIVTLYFFCTPNSQTYEKNMQSILGGKEKKKRLKLLAIFYAFLGAIWLMATQSPVLALSFVFIGLNIIAAPIVSSTWIFSPSRRKTWLLSFSAIGLIQALALYAVSVRGMQAPSAGARMISAEYLGILGPKIDDQFIRTAAEKPLGPGDAHRLVQLITPRDRGGEVIWYTWNATSATVPYRDFIANQTNETTLHWLVSLFNPTSLTEKDLHYLLDRQKDSDKKYWSTLPAQPVWINVQIQEKTIIQFLKSDDEFKMKFALKYMEFNPRPGFIKPLAEKLRTNLPGDLIPQAVTTLSLLVGEKLDLRTYQARVRTGATNKFHEDSCEESEIGKLLSKKEGKDELDFNRCLRNLAISHANASAVSEIYRWYSLPLEDYQEANLRKALREN